MPLRPQSWSFEQRGFETMDQWSEMLTDLGRPHEEVIDRLERVIRRQAYIGGALRSQGRSAVSGAQK